MEKWTPITSVIPDAEKELARRYRLPLEAPLYDLLNALREYGTRDLLPGWTGDRFKSLRAEAYAEALAIKKSARAIAKASDRLADRVTRFAKEYQFNPELMRAILRVDMGPPSELFGPAELRALRPAEADEMRKLVGNAVQGLAELPVQERRKPGAVAHTTLKNVVASCREYWRGEGRSWSMDVLDAVQPGDDATILTGLCERFVADALGATGFPFELPELRAAWKHR